MGLTSVLLCALAALVTFATVSSVIVDSVSVTLNFSTVANSVDARYVSANFDWHLNDEEPPAWINASVAALNLSDANLRFLAQQLSPAILRVGGSEEDDLYYELPGAPCPPPPVGNFCVTMQLWEQLADFAAATGMDIAFGLNAMTGRTNTSTPMNMTTLEAWFAYISQLPHAPYAFEFGNELEHAVDAGVYSADVLRVRALLDAYWPDAATRPKLVANDENPDASYWSTLLPAAGRALDAATWHLYIGYGLDPTLPAKAWSRAFLDGIAATAAPQVLAARATGFLPNASHQLWVGETAMAWHSGRNGTTNTFLSGPWWLAQLGTLAGTHHVQCRQTLVGGYYELLNKWDTTPNPDWWTAVLWKRCMGAAALPLPAVNDSDVLAFAHCAAGGTAAPRGAVTVAFVNLNATHSKAVELFVGGGAAPVPVPTTPRDEYILSAVGAENARAIALNGAPLQFYSPGNMSSLEPVHVGSGSTAVMLPPHTYGFVVLWDAGATLC